jgi:hypothetical protein
VSRSPQTPVSIAFPTPHGRCTLRLLYWSKRALTGCVALWAGLIVVYVTLGLAGQEVFRPPYNVLILLIVATATAGSASAWLAAHVVNRLTAHLGTHQEQISEQMDVRDGRLYFEMARIRGEVAQLRELIEQTADLSRPALALVGSAAYDDGYADGLARLPARDAKVLPIERH